MDTERIAVKPFLICLVLLALAELCRMALLPQGRPLDAVALAIIGGFRLTELALFLGAILLWGKGLASLGLAGYQILPGIKMGVIWSIGFGALVIAGFGILFLLGINPFALFRAPMPKETHTLVLFFLLGGVIAPVAEEVFFRCILYGFFRKWGVAVALILSTLLFALAHPGASLTQTVGGIIFALAYEREGKLMTPIVIHALGNSALFTLSLLAKI